MAEAAGNATDPSAASDARFMRAALEAARRALAAGEPPVGACLVHGDEIVVTAANAVIGELDTTAHAEIQVIRRACRELRRLDLAGCTLYVTVEPCRMCRSACYYAGIGQVVFGAPIDAITAVTGRELDAGSDEELPRLRGGCLEAESRALIDA